MSVLKIKDSNNQWVHIPTIEGADGITPDVNVTTITGGHNVAFDYGTGDSRNTDFDVMDGEDGTSAYASVSKSGTTATITITDAQGTSTATVSDGQDGAKGDKGDIYNILDAEPKTNGTVDGVTYTWSSDGRCTVNGRATADSDLVIRTVSQGMPPWLVAGAKYHVKFSGTNVSINLACFDPTAWISNPITNTKTFDGVITIPDATTRVHLRLRVDNGATADEVVYPRFYLVYPAVSDDVVQVSGTDVSITGVANTRYVCGEVSTISITPPAQGIIDVIFTSGTSAAILTLPQTVKMPSGFAVEASKTYEINIMDGVYGAVMSWI